VKIDTRFPKMSGSCPNGRGANFGYDIDLSKSYCISFCKEALIFKQINICPTRAAISCAMFETDIVSETSSASTVYINAGIVVLKYFQLLSTCVAKLSVYKHCSLSHFKSKCRDTWKLPLLFHAAVAFCR
jgi:hypothetical protein